MCDVCDILYDDEYQCTVHERGHGRDEFEAAEQRDMRVRTTKERKACRRGANKRPPADRRNGMNDDNDDFLSAMAIQTDDYNVDMFQMADDDDFSALAGGDEPRRKSKPNCDGVDRSTIDVPYACALCLRHFKVASDLKEHTRKEHSKLETQATICPDCGHRFSSARLMRRHRLVVHSNERLFKCAACNTDYNRRDTYITHLASKRHADMIMKAERATDDAPSRRDSSDASDRPTRASKYWHKKACEKSEPQHSPIANDHSQASEDDDDRRSHGDGSASIQHD
jgi:DNA-directed RNA polymerase subunit RPC12/RpoP